MEHNSGTEDLDPTQHIYDEIYFLILKCYSALLTQFIRCYGVIILQEKKTEMYQILKFDYI